MVARKTTKKANKAETPAVAEASPAEEHEPESAPEPRDARLAPTEEQVAARAFLLFLRGSSDAVANWHRAERDMEWVVNRAYALFLDGETDGFANWLRAVRELDDGDRAS